jgi:hypothetical protein
MLVRIAVVCLLAACAKESPASTAAETDPATCERYQAQLAIDRPYLALHEPLWYSAPYSDLSPELHQKLAGDDIATLAPVLVDGAVGCDAAREAVATLRHRDPDAADVETFVVANSWLLERRIGWLPVTDSALAEAAGGQVQVLVDLAEWGRML